MQWIATPAIRRARSQAATNQHYSVRGRMAEAGFPIQVDVTWTGVGSATKQHGHDQFSTAGFKETASHSGVFRAATASGTITDAQTNSSPAPALFAHLAKNSFNDRHHQPVGAHQLAEGRRHRRPSAAGRGRHGGTKSP